MHADEWARLFMCSEQQISPDAKEYLSHQPNHNPGNPYLSFTTRAPQPLICYLGESRGRSNRDTFSDSPVDKISLNDQCSVIDACK